VSIRTFVVTTLLAALLAIGGCAMSSGVQKLGPDTYSVSASAAPVRGGYSEARRIALEDANKYCSHIGREIVVTNVDTATTNVHGAGSADITFRCLLPGDPQLRRPEYRRAPDTVIEDRRR